MRRKRKTIQIESNAIKNSRSDNDLKKIISNIISKEVTGQLDGVLSEKEKEQLCKVYFGYQTQKLFSAAALVNSILAYGLDSKNTFTLSQDQPGKSQSERRARE